MPIQTIPAQSTRSLDTLHRIKRLIRLPLLLAICIRLGIATALISFIGFRVLGNLQRSRFEKYHGLGDVAYVAWLVLSSALFFPCAALVDLALCAAITYKLKVVGILSFLHGWNRTENPGVYLIQLASLIEFLTIICIGFLRTLGLCFATVEGCYLARGPSSSVCQASFNLIVGARYDWWTFRALPEDFTSQKWHRRMWRPWLPHSPSPQPPFQQYKPNVIPLLSIFFGSKTFRSRRGERRWLVILRGLAAMCCVGALTAYATNTVFLQPTNENRWPLVQIQRLSKLPNEGSMHSPTWGVIVGINTRFTPLTSGLTLGDLIVVTSELSSSSTILPRCSSTTFTSTQVILNTFQFISYQCTTLWIEKNQGYTPQILIEADYTALNVSSESLPPEGRIKIWPSFTSNVAQVLESTKPESLIMGNSLIASVTGTLRSRFTAPTRAMFGFSSHRELFMVGQLTVLGTDPQAAAGPPLNMVATMRIFKELQWTDWGLYTDTRQHTTLAGLSAAGGLSVFFNSIFIIFFGGSLVLVLFDIKPLSVFGVIHLFSRKTLADRFTADFPRLREEGGQPGQRDSGPVAFMREYMLDLPLGQKPIDASPATSSAPEVLGCSQNKY